MHHRMKGMGATRSGVMPTVPGPVCIRLRADLPAGIAAVALGRSAWTDGNRPAAHRENRHLRMPFSSSRPPPLIWGSDEIRRWARRRHHRYS